jgi:hypothetical protein
MSRVRRERHLELSLVSLAQPVEAELVSPFHILATAEAAAIKE